MRRSPRPTTCSHKSCVPNARTPGMCVTVLTSQPLVSIETETTQRTCSPSLPAFPTVFMTSRSRSSSVSSSTSRPGKRARYSDLNSSISAAAMVLKSALMPSPDSSCSLSTRMLFGRDVQRPSCLEAAAPHPGVLVAARGLGALIRAQGLVLGIRLPPVAVVRLVVDDDDVPPPR